MTNFEKMAIQFECCGDILSVPSVEKVLNGMVGDDVSNLVKRGCITKAVGICMKYSPEAMKCLAALETSKTEQEIEDLNPEELSATMVDVFVQYILPFFVSGAKQDGGE